MEDVGLLKKIGFFNGLTTMELAHISKITQRVAFSEGQEIMKEGTGCDALYIVKQGAVKVLKSGKEIITLNEGSPIGEVSFVDQSPRSATVIADTDSVLIKIPMDALNRLMEREKDIACKIFRSIAITLCQRLRDANETLFLLSPEDTEKP